MSSTASNAPSTPWRRYASTAAAGSLGTAPRSGDASTAALTARTTLKAVKRFRTEPDRRYSLGASIPRNGPDRWPAGLRWRAPCGTSLPPPSAAGSSGSSRSTPLLTEQRRSIAPSTYYDNLHRKPSKRALRDAEIIAITESDGERQRLMKRFGARKMWLHLRSMNLGTRRPRGNRVPPVVPRRPLVRDQRPGGPSLTRLRARSGAIRFAGGRILGLDLRHVRLQPRVLGLQAAQPLRSRLQPSWRGSRVGDRGGHRPGAERLDPVRQRASGDLGIVGEALNVAPDVDSYRSTACRRNSSESFFPAR